MTGKYQSIQRRTCPCATLSTTNSTCYGIKTAFEVRHQQQTAWFMAMPKIQSEELPGSSEQTGR